MADEHASPDPFLERVVAELRKPLDLGDEVDRRVLARVRGDLAPRVQHRRRLATRWAGLAAAAVVAGFVLMNRATAPGPGVRFVLREPLARSIALVGDFNDWNPAMTPLEPGRNGEWRVSLDLPPGRYRYGYLVDDRTLVPDPNRPAVPDPDFNAPTSLITVLEAR